MTIVIDIGVRIEAIFAFSPCSPAGNRIQVEVMEVHRNWLLGSAQLNVDDPLFATTAFAGSSTLFHVPLYMARASSGGHVAWQRDQTVGRAMKLMSKQPRHKLNAKCGHQMRLSRRPWGPGGQAVITGRHALDKTRGKYVVYGILRTLQ